ncbi:hypothetical protein H5410_044879 [Solanum commersonii]|uniref:Uncharacterized protein n=1 Tax=Solanum commersonii TaxID=4109 RepID=A0A9J5XA66_SOLCO|nr:hypothetical protein H5410_044879 [Solanum commersonii]
MPKSKEVSFSLAHSRLKEIRISTFLDGKAAYICHTAVIYWLKWTFYCQLKADHFLLRIIGFSQLGSVDLH